MWDPHVYGATGRGYLLFSAVYLLEHSAFVLAAVPDPPESLSVVNYGTHMLKATWSPPREVFDDKSKVRYCITASAHNSSFNVTFKANTTSRALMVTGLLPGLMYTVKVCCLNNSVTFDCVCACVHVCVHAGMCARAYACVLVSIGHSRIAVCWLYINYSLMLCIYPSYPLTMVAVVLSRTMQVSALNSMYLSSPAMDTARTWALPPTLTATNRTSTSVLLTAVFPSGTQPIQQVVLQQVRV